MSSISICISAGHMAGIAVESEPAVLISVTAAPTLAIPTEGQSAIELLATGTYTVSDGTITGQIAEGSLNGAPFSATVMNTTLAPLDVLVVREVVTASGGQTAVFSTNTVSVAAVSPTVTVSIDQPGVDVAAVLGTDLTAGPQITTAGSPALLAGDIILTWQVNGTPAAVGTVLNFGDSVQAVAAWTHPSGAGSVVSDALMVPLAQAPALSVQLVQGGYAADTVLTAGEILTTIPTPGYPALVAGDVGVALEVNGSIVALPYTARTGDILVPLATAAHASGLVTARGLSAIVTAKFTVLEQPGGTVLIEGGTGDLTITITEPAVYAGTYTQDVDGLALNTANMASGPQCFFSPSITGDGSPTEGEGLSSRNGLWIYEADQPQPTQSIAWQRSPDGLSGWTDIAGATTDTYTISAADSGQILRRRDLLTQPGAGGRSAVSNALAVAGVAAPGLDLSHASSGGVAAGNLSTALIASLGLPAPTAGREFIALLAWRPQGGDIDITSVTLAGTPGMPIGLKIGSDTGNVFIQAFSFAVPNGTTGNLAATFSGNCQDLHAHLFRATNWRLVAAVGAAPVGPAAGVPIGHGIAIATGQALIAGSIARGSTTLAGVATGYGADAQIQPQAGRFSLAGHHVATADEAPRSVSTTWNGILNEAACLSLVIGAA